MNGNHGNPSSLFQFLTYVFMSLKQITFSTLMLLSLIYFEFSGPSLAGAWKRVQQCKEWDEINKYMTTRLTDLLDSAEYHETELDRKRLALWEARHAVIVSLQSNFRVPQWGQLAYIDLYDAISDIKEEMRAIKRRTNYEEIPDVQYALGTSQTYGTVVTEPGFYGGEVAGPIYRLPPPRKLKEKERVDIFNPFSSVYDEEGAIQAAIAASLDEQVGADSEAASSSQRLSLVSDDYDPDLELAIRLSLMDQGGASSSNWPSVGSSSDALSSSAGPSHPPRSEPDDGFNLDDLDFSEL